MPQIKKNSTDPEIVLKDHLDSTSKIEKPKSKEVKKEEIKLSKGIVGNSTNNATKLAKAKK